MKTKLIGLVIAVVCNTAQAQEVTATGHGSSFNDALQNAKVLATEYAATTFVTGHQEIVNGKHREVLGQYNGGLIQKYTVTDKSLTNTGWAVTIRADVDTSKVNEIIVSNTTSVQDATPQVNKFVDEHTKTNIGWDSITAATPPFSLTLDDANYSVFDGKIVDATYHLRVQWNPKWINDAKQLTKAIDRSPVSGKYTQAVCFKQNAADAGECSGVLTLPNTKTWQSMEFTAVVRFNNGMTETHRVYATPSTKLFVKSLARMKDSGWFATVHTVPALTLYQNEVSPIDLRLSFDVEKFKTVADVQFVPVL